jgi:SAM-dependent methyltransferase
MSERSPGMNHQRADTHSRVAATPNLPTPAVRRRRFRFATAEDHRLTHQLFRFPAKFHPPVVRALLEEYTRPGQHVLDPFCGSGTLLVEAAVAGRSATGTDVDPVAVFVSDVKSHGLRPDPLARRLEELLAQVERFRRRDYEALQWIDLNERQYTRELRGLVVPAIPNLEHWFRRYVTVDLARLRQSILSLQASRVERRFLLLCFAAIIRNASNADPVPVSGLEVTSHMLSREAEGRVVDPFALFETATRRAIRDMGAYHEAADPDARIRAKSADATTLRRHLRRGADAVITSPPYHGAVDYYRRHQLEMFWLDLTRSQDDRLDLLQHYIGRPKVSARHPFVANDALVTPKAKRLESRIRRVDEKRADALKHYCVAMQCVFSELAHLLRSGSPVLMIVGHSGWNGDSLNTSDLFAELSAPDFHLDEQLWYPVRNRYMSYSRHNGASIDREFVLVLRRT